MAGKNVRKKIENCYEKKYFIFEVYYKSDYKNEEEDAFIGYVAAIKCGNIDFEVELVALPDKYKKKYEEAIFHIESVYENNLPYILGQIAVVSTTENMVVDMLQGLIDANFKE